MKSGTAKDMARA